MNSTPRTLVPSTEHAVDGDPTAPDGIQIAGMDMPRSEQPRRPLSTWLVVAVAIVAAVASAVIFGGSDFPSGWTVPVGAFVERAFEAFLAGGGFIYEPIAATVTTAYGVITTTLQAVSPPVLAVAAVIGVCYFRGIRLAALTVTLLGWVMLTGLWETTVQTVAFMAVVVLVSSVVGVALALFAVTSPKVETGVKLALDALQAFPAFAYLVPIIFLFGVGNTGALIVSVLWAMPPIARMTIVGLRSVSPAILEAGVASGADRRQLMFGVRFPAAAPSIRAGLNQTVMYAITMATLAAMIGAVGLGAPVWSGLSRLEFGDALEGGIAIVLLAILIDRLSSPRQTPSSLPSHDVHTRRPLLGALSVLGAVIVVSQLIPGEWQDFDDPPWGKVVDLRQPVGAAVSWLTTSWGPLLDAATSVIQLQLLNPLGAFFGSIPWFAVVLCIAAVGVAVAGTTTGVVLGIAVFGIGCLGMWDSTGATLAVVTTAIILVVLLGFPLGVAMSVSDTLAMLFRPVLDVMQSMPVYLFVIPAAMLFGTGEVSAVLATFLAAVCPMVRFTDAALRGVDSEVVEAAVSCGAGFTQILRQVRIPLGIKTIAVGLNQAVLLALAMAVVSAMVGAPGLGQDILASVQTVDLPRGVEAGLAMFILGVVIDRLLDGSAKALTTTTHTQITDGKVGA